MKAITILGTRPEIIKLSPLIPFLEREFGHTIIHTGQHYDVDMDKCFFEDLQLPQPKYNLAVGSAAPGKQTAAMLEKIESVLAAEKPDLVIIHGDTNSALAGALAAVKMYLNVAHVEAGCRSFNKRVPEEANRVMIDHISDHLFAPDKVAVSNLVNEGIPESKIYNFGSTAFEAVLRNKEYVERRSLKELEHTQKRYILVTLHRADNTETPANLKSILAALNLLAEETEIIFPIHPRTKKVILESSIALNERIKVLKPQSYLSFLSLLANCTFCISDSGGIQEEALALNIPCLIPRQETEWKRLVEAGKNILVGTGTKKIVETARVLLHNEFELQRIKDIKYPFEVNVSEKIIEVLKEIKNDSQYS